MKKKPLTKIQKEIIDYILKYQKEHKMSPRQVEISEHFGWKFPSAAQDHLDRLERNVHIKQGDMRKDIKVL